MVALSFPSSRKNLFSANLVLFSRLWTFRYFHHGSTSSSIHSLFHSFYLLLAKSTEVMYGWKHWLERTCCWSVHSFVTIESEIYGCLEWSWTFGKVRDHGYCFQSANGEERIHRLCNTSIFHAWISSQFAMIIMIQSRRRGRICLCISIFLTTYVS